MKPDTIIIRYGELALKSDQTRKKFEKKLVNNIKIALQKDFIDFDDIRREYGRIFIDTDEKQALKVLPRVFGIISVSRAISCQPDLKSISEVALFLAKNIKKTDTFAIRARRTGEQDYTSKEVETKIGALVQEKTGAKVNLNNPKKQIQVEARQKKAYLFTEKISGPGGLPMGIEGKVLGIYSEKNFDLALWLLAKRGCDLEIVSTKADKEKAEKLSNKMTDWFGSVRVNTAKTNDYKLLSKLAKELEAKAIVTADILDKNLKVLAEFAKLDKNSSLPIFRPLIGLSKQEIVELRRIL